MDRNLQFNCLSRWRRSFSNHSLTSSSSTSLSVPMMQCVRRAACGVRRTCCSHGSHSCSSANQSQRCSDVISDQTDHGRFSFIAPELSSLYKYFTNILRILRKQKRFHSLLNCDLDKILKKRVKNYRAVWDMN